MPIEQVWFAPLLILPGVALLILSTATRYTLIHAEVHNALDQYKSEDTKSMLHILLVRCVRFRNALVALYVSAGLLAAASFFGGALTRWPVLGDDMMLYLSGAGIVCLIYALYQLIHESLRSLHVIRSHLRERM
ncbi:MAG TPA: DUF2721 domain-containing protein [Gammaproteobacteria bacterium]|nr:DUF2721 domain-containing protein [Gammaproteobacteria bacterium]